MNRVVLNRKQIGRLVEIYERFDDTEHFTLESSSPSGIGPTITIQFDLFEKSDTKIDITDVSEW
jgi:hypothetical protein